MDSAETKVTKKAMMFEEAVVSVPQMSDESFQRVASTFKNNLKNIIFRRVEKIFLEPENLKNIRIWSGSVENYETYVEYTKENIPEFSPEQEEKCVEYICSSYFLFTTKTVLRENDTYVGKKIYASSKRYREINWLDGRFDMNPSNNEVVPKNGNLICGLVENGAKGPQFKFWFTCSEQFFRCWTAIMYETHDSFKSSSEIDIRKSLMAGNRLCTNGYRKWRLVLQQENIIPTQEEVEKKYWRISTEAVSRDYVHFYAALTLIIRYGELPFYYNIPNNSDGSTRFTFWDIPPGWVEALCARYEITSSLVMKIVKIPKLTTFIVHESGFTPMKVQEPQLEKENEENLIQN